MLKILFTLVVFLSFISCTHEKNKRENKVINSIVESEIERKYPIYLIEESYFIDDIEYIPEENYNYNEVGLASYFGKSFHGKLSKNNEIINITELIAAHKTLPLPSVIKVTNLNNNISLILRVNNRGPKNNNEILMVSQFASKLLGFYDQKTTKVKIEVIEWGDGKYMKHLD